MIRCWMVALGMLAIGVWASTSGAATMAFLLKWGAEGGGPGQFSSPLGIAVGPGDEVYVADSGNHRVQVFDSQGSYLREWHAASGVPKGIAIGPGGEVFVVEVGLTAADTSRIQVFSANGSSLRSWGGKGAANGQFFSPFGIGVDNA